MKQIIDEHDPFVFDDVMVDGLKVRDQTAGPAGTESLAATDAEIKVAI